MLLTPVAVHLERKAIAASLKDLDSVIKKLDHVFLFIVFIIAIIVFISILSGSAAAVLGTSGTTILGLSWYVFQKSSGFLSFSFSSPFYIVSGGWLLLDCSVGKLPLVG